MTVALIVGGAGALGTAIVDSCKKLNWNTISVDMKQSRNAEKSIIIQDSKVEEVVAQLDIPQVDYVYCVAGSWKGGNVSDPKLMESSQQMWKVNVEPSIMAAQLASKLGAKVLVVTAAKAVVHGTPDMLGYGMAKQAVVHLAKSLADDYSFGAKSICIMPEVIDTDANRAAMPGADTSRWTKLEVLGDYLTNACLELPSGTLMTVVTRNHQTEFKAM